MERPLRAADCSHFQTRQLEALRNTAKWFQCIACTAMMIAGYMGGYKLHIHETFKPAPTTLKSPPQAKTWWAPNQRRQRDIQYRSLRHKNSCYCDDFLFKIHAIAKIPRIWSIFRHYVIFLLCCYEITKISLLYTNIASELPTCFYEITKVLLSRWPAAVFSKSRSTVTSVLAILMIAFIVFIIIVIDTTHVSIIKVMRNVIVAIHLVLSTLMLKNGHILPTGQWYAPSAVIKHAWYAWYCMVLHCITW